MLSYEAASLITYPLRHAFSCSEGWIAGICSTIHLQNHPMDAAIALIAPLYLRPLTQSETEVFDSFIRQYQSYFDTNSKIEDNDPMLKNYIEQLGAISRKYYFV